MRFQLWAMEPSYLENWLSRRENITAEAIAAFLARTPDDEDDDPLDDILDIDGSTATIRICGPLSQSGPSRWDRYFDGADAGTGYQQIIDAFDEAETTPGVDNITAKINTPGGDVAGGDLVWQRIRACKIPVTAESHGMIASMGFWIASACTRIVATSPSDSIGSIGIKIAGIDDTEYLKGLGLKRVEIFSKNASNKAASVSTKAGRDILQERCDALERCFLDRVAEGRGVTADYVAQNFGQGGLLLARDPDPTRASAIGVKMIDGIINLHAQANAAPTQGPATTFALASELIGHDQVSDPAPNAGSHNQEGKPMTFEEFMAQNPDARARLDQMKADARSEGYKAAKAETARVGAILASDTYSANKIVKAKALAALKGEASMEALESVVTMADMLAEQTKSDAAAAEQERQEETAAQADQTQPIDVTKLTAEGVAKLTKEQLAAFTPTQLAMVERISLGLAVEKKE